jgi:signal transduction histidine kinase
MSGNRWAANGVRRLRRLRRVADCSQSGCTFAAVHSRLPPLLLLNGAVFMQDVVSISPTVGRSGGRPVLPRLLAYLPRGNTLDDRAWHRRHLLLERVLLLHVPLLVGLGLALGHSAVQATEAVIAPLVCLVLGHLVTHRRWASFFITGGLVFCSVGLVLLTSGSIEAHFHFFIIIGFIALYQDWVPFLWNVGFTTISHGAGTIWLGGQIFNHPAAQAHPWLWSFVHGVAVLFACVGMVIFWRITEDEQVEKEALGRQLITADAEIGRRQFTSEMLVNLARRNQSMLYRQLDIINELEDREQDPDALADLFKLDHLATRVRRNAESLLVLAGQQTPRTWSEPVPLRDVIRAAIAETEDLDRVVFAVDDRIAVSGTAIADLTHLLAELTENAVRFSPPETAVTIRVRPNRRDEGGHLLTVEDWGVGMPPDDLAEANQLLAHPGDIDLAVAQRLGFHVVARLATRHKIAVSLTATPGSGITAVVVLPAALFTQTVPPGPVAPLPGGAAFDAVRPNTAASHDGFGRPQVEAGPAGRSATADGAWMPPFRTASEHDNGPAGPDGRWRGWWNPETHAGTDASSGFGSTGRQVRSNGSGANGHATNGHGVNGHGANGSNGTNGHGANGHGSNGHDANGQGTNGHATNGHGTNGHKANATNGVAADGPGAEWRDVEARDADEAGRPAAGPPVPGNADGADRRTGPGAAATEQTRAFPATPPEGTPPVTGIPLARREPAEVRHEVASGIEVPRAAVARMSGSLDAAPGSPAGRRLPGRPSPGPGPIAALPQPRNDEVAPPTASRPGTAASRGLRRRVPQSHLAPELRHPVTGPADTAAAPLSADAAASALSRYQASRLAAQAGVSDPDVHHQGFEGERE